MAAVTEFVPLDLPELSFIRMLDAPRELVFRAWTSAACVAAWWGPHGFSIPLCEVDPRPGGRFAVHMRGPDGTLYPGGGVFLEIAAPELLAFTSTLTGGNGRVLIDAVNTVSFEDLGPRTKMTLDARVVSAARQAAGSLAGMEEGWTQSLERLAAIVKAAGAAPRQPPAVPSYARRS
ncbi:MAG: SRPBCC domain-containing protein [Mesorhizobium sp.]|nr:SRPBCC domain-containing protein [Mesorhizobium sp.]